VKGQTVYLFAFDVASEIRTSEVRELLGQNPFPFQIRVGGAAPRDVPFTTPLTISLPPLETDTNVGRATLRRFVKVFEVGVISISFEVPFDVATLGALVPYHRVSCGRDGLDVLAERLARDVVKALQAQLVKPSPEHPPVEAYTVFCIEGLEGDVADWARANRAAVAALLNEEAQPARLAADQIDETFRHALSYTSEDYAVIDWDAALVVDRSGYTDDVLYMMELANLQLEEWRLLDDRLDRLFAAAYDDLETHYARPRLFGPPGKRLRALRSIRMDITRMSEEVSNITKFVGDWYLARVYLACKDRFHLGHWEASVDQKLHELDRLYSIVHQEINERRMLIMEAMIVALFILDVLVLILWKK
jgi:hypothetical protein